MVEVQVQPMPTRIRKLPAWLRPSAAPVFAGGEPTSEDRELALELWRALDVDSRRWYTHGGTATHFCGLPLTAEDLAAMGVEVAP